MSKKNKQYQNFNKENSVMQESTPIQVEVSESSVKEEIGLFGEPIVENINHDEDTDREEVVDNQKLEDDGRTLFDNVTEEEVNSDIKEEVEEVIEKFKDDKKEVVKIKEEDLVKEVIKKIVNFEDLDLIVEEVYKTRHKNVDIAYKLFYSKSNRLLVVSTNKVELEDMKVMLEYGYRDLDLSSLYNIYVYFPHLRTPYTGGVKSEESIDLFNKYFTQGEIQLEDDLIKLIENKILLTLI